MLPVPLEALGTTLWEDPRGQRLRSRFSHSPPMQAHRTPPPRSSLGWAPWASALTHPLASSAFCLGALMFAGGAIRESQRQESCPTGQCDGCEFHSQPSFLPVCPEWAPSLQFLVTGNKHWVAVSPSPSLSVRTGVGQGQTAQPPSPSIPPRETPGWGPSEEEPEFPWSGPRSTEGRQSWEKDHDFREGPTSTL